MKRFKWLFFFVAGVFVLLCWRVVMGSAVPREEAAVLKSENRLVPPRGARAAEGRDALGIESRLPRSWISSRQQLRSGRELSPLDREREIERPITSHGLSKYDFVWDYYGITDEIAHQIYAAIFDADGEVLAAIDSVLVPVGRDDDEVTWFYEPDEKLLGLVSALNSELAALVDPVFADRAMPMVHQRWNVPLIEGFGVLFRLYWEPFPFDGVGHGLEIVDGGIWRVQTSYVRPDGRMIGEAMNLYQGRSKTLPASVVPFQRPSS